MRYLLLLFFLIAGTVKFYSQPAFFYDNTRHDNLDRLYITPKRIVWKSDSSGVFLKSPELLLIKGNGQADLNNNDYFIIKNDDNSKSAIVLDFGREIHGGVQIVTTMKNSNNGKSAGKVRITLGESVGEAMSNLCGKSNARNDHALRDFIIDLPWLGKIEVGNSGFRFLRLELLNKNHEVQIKEINAKMVYRNIPYLGSFKSNDELLNKVWMTGAYTVHLNMQDYLWDGIKRDRLVWVGDMHPEIMTILNVFGFNSVITKSLDLARSTNKLPGWMNDMSSYSLWWLIMQYELYKYTADINYLNNQKEYIFGLLNQMSKCIDKNGVEKLPNQRFLDWPTSRDSITIHAGLQSLMIMAFEAGKKLCNIISDKNHVDLCIESLKKLRKHIPDLPNVKQGAALMSLSGIVSPELANAKVLSKNGAEGFSTFYGYYMLQAMAKAGDYVGALSNIRSYWGAMIDLGATTFWEDFNLGWKRNASRIDEIVPKGKVDIHASYGDYCYIGYRHSLCHGWASGPTAWLSENILGFKIIEPGCKTVLIDPNLGDLEWVKGSFPTPYGVIYVEHRKKGDKIESFIKSPKEVKIIKGRNVI